MKKESKLIFDRNVVEFVTVAAEYCAFLEGSHFMARQKFVDTILKILPLLYIKASMLPSSEIMSENELETFVTEGDYEELRTNLAEIMGDCDDYLDVFVQDMVYSDTPIKKNISEDLTDIYQDIKNFISIFKLGLNETMHDSVAQCRNNFELFWGQTLVNTMRALHEVKYSQSASNDDVDDYKENE